MFQTVFLKISLFTWVVLCISCTNKQEPIPLPYYNTPEFTPEFYKNPQEGEQNISHQIGGFSLTDQNGHIITEKDIVGKIHVANFIFTSCGSICPTMTSHLKMVQEAFKRDSEVVMLSFSVMPWVDSVPRLKKYAENNDIHAPNWHILTGSTNDIYTLARQSYYAEEDLGFSRDSTDFLHTEHVLLVDKTKRIRGIYNGTLQLDIEQLIKDISLLKNE